MYDDRICNQRMLPKSRFDSVKLDAKTANLNLPIDAPDKFKVAVRPVANQISGPVKTGTFKERVLNKSLGCQFGLVQITAREPDSPDA